ncbi:MAG: isoprenylcysteine carboxylmethyltransferase family protein [Rudanella sp.]|nr:isoprenylcysteine carboxylmethyltransferase family protein [Rudanella sp.]
MPYLLLAATWLFFGFTHSLTASTRFKAWATKQMGSFSAHNRLIYNGLSVLTLLPAVLVYTAAPTDYIGQWQGSVWLGVLLIGAGVLLVGIALSGYNLREFVGVTGGTSQENQPKKFRQGGLLRYVRHPLYVGIIVALGGLFVYAPIWATLLFNMLAISYIRTGIYFEERKLVAEYGAAYRDYQKRVPMLIPAIASRPA